MIVFILITIFLSWPNWIFPKLIEIPHDSCINNVLKERSNDVSFNGSIHKIALVALITRVFANAFSKIVPTNPLSGINEYVPLHYFEISSNNREFIFYPNPNVLTTPGYLPLFLSR